MFHFFTKIDSISTDELEKRLKSNIQLIDVRTPSEFRRGHIKEAQNVPLSQIGQFVPAKKETIYVICHSGVRSKMAAKKLKKKGYDVVNVRGGMSAWTGKTIKEKGLNNENYYHWWSCRRYVCGNTFKTDDGRC